MPSPYPGMDPYLERPSVWEPFHATLMIRIADQLQPLVAPRYLVRPQERLGVVFQECQILPDVAVSARDRSTAPAGVVPASASPPVGARLLRSEEVPTRQTSLRILDAETRRLVTAIEVLSPTNKRGDGFRSYARKQADVLSSDAHLVEIDLLRAGRHAAAVPEALLDQIRPYDYLVCVSRASDRATFECYTFGLRDAIPPVFIPLLAPDPDVELDLRAALCRTYDAGCYGLDLDYGSPADPPLRPEERQWAEALLQSRERPSADGRR